MVPARGDAAFRAAFAHAAIGMSLVTLDGHYLQVNEAFCRMIGYSEAELLATDWQHITHPEDLETDLDHVRRLLAGEVTHYHMEKRYIRQDGGILPILLSVALVREPDGTPEHFVSQIQDLTSRRRLEAERLDAERRVAELERQASMNLIAGSIAHDFNNLLATVIGFTALARDHVAPGSPVCRYLDEIESASQEAARLSHQMLAYSGSAKYDLREVDVAGTVRHAAQRTLARFPETHLEVELMAPLSPVVGDDVQLQQALVNVLENACEAVQESKGRVRVGAQVSSDKRSVQIRVADTGAGIAPNMLPRIFDPFLTTKFVGRGLGLSAALGIVRAHQGTIEVVSEPGGTTVTILIPVKGDSAAGTR